MSMSTLEAIQTLTALTTLAVRAADAAQHASQLIANAQAEDRDLTAEEAAKIRDMRRQAVKRWNEGMKG